MSITTEMPPDKVLCLDLVRNDVLTCLKRQPNVPVTVDEMVGNIAGVTHSQIVRALFEIEGPVTSGDGDDAYVHRCRCSDAAVYIT